jgi:hypothetical protein
MHLLRYAEGADEYVVKPKVEQMELLEAIGQDDMKRSES